MKFGNIGTNVPGTNGSSTELTGRPNFRLVIPKSIKDKQCQFEIKKNLTLRPCGRISTAQRVSCVTAKP